MPLGKTIRIYLADGSASGIRHAELVNWTGQAIVSPRARVGELMTWKESQRPGAYILFGDDPDGPRPAAYIGEAENVADRLRTHLSDPKKEFWNQVVFFTSKDDNLTKAHVKYLESRMIHIAKQVEQAKLWNDKGSDEPRLPRAERDAMEEFLGPARLLLAALGFNVLKAVSKKSGGPGTTDGPTGPLAEIPLFFRVPKRGVDAEGRSTDDGLVVLEGSVGDSHVRKSLSAGWRAVRDDLFRDGSLVEKEGQIRVERDIAFSSASAAASVLPGGVWNGRAGWKTSDGRTLSELEDAQTEAAAEDEG